MGEGQSRVGEAGHVWVRSPGGSAGVGHTTAETQQAGGLQGWGLAPSARIPELKWR